jgi:GT2 family glycosyltransferase
MSAESAGACALDATVLICSRDRAALLDDTVRSVLSGTAVPRELLVIDQSSAPARDLSGLGAARGCDVRHLRSSTTGLSRARNIGLREARCDVVVLIDDDMFVETDWLARLLGALDERDGRLVVTGRVLPAPSETRDAVVPAAALVTSPVPAVYRGRQPRDVVPGANVAFQRSVALRLGGYDERFGAGARFAAADDNDMGLRLLEDGCEVRHVPDAVVYHRAWRSAGGRIRLRWAYGRGKGAFYAKHMSWSDPYIRRRFASEVAMRLRRSAGSLFTEPVTAAAQLVSLAGTLSGALEWALLVRGRSGGGESASSDDSSSRSVPPLY